MAFQNGAVGRANGMQDQTNFDARSGAAKHPQTSFPVAHGMRDRTDDMPGISPVNPGTGPDASSPNPLASEPRVRTLRRQPTVLRTPWGMKDANGNGVDQSMAGRVLGEGILRGAALPSATHEN